MSYYDRTRQPLISLIFVLPMWALYELTLRSHTWYGRSAADLWIRNVTGDWLAPLVLPAILLGWHVVVGRPKPERLLTTLARMGVESFGWAVLFVNANVAMGLLVSQTLSVRPEGWILRSIGAGLYEETLFRLIWLPIVYWVGHAAGLQRSDAFVSVLLSAHLFACAHYFPSFFVNFEFYKFFCWCGAGVFFGILFLRRGFGIAVGAHVTVDLLILGSRELRSAH